MDKDQAKDKLIYNDEPEKEEVADEPQDRFNVIYIICLILGVGTLLAYNMMVTASDFLTNEYPDYKSIMFWVVPAYSVPNVTFTLLMILYGKKFSFSTRVVCSFLSTAVVTGLVPFFAVHVSESPSYDLVMGVCAFIGFSAAVLQATTIGFTNLLPGKYTQANIAGQSIAGILACIIRVLTKAFEPANNHGYIQGGWIYFSTGAIGSAFCALAFIYALRTAFVRHHLHGYMKSKKSMVTSEGKTISIANKTTTILAHIADQEDYDDTIKAEENGNAGTQQQQQDAESNISANVSNLDGSLIPAGVQSSNADSQILLNKSIKQQKQGNIQPLQSNQGNGNTYQSIGNTSGNFPPPQHPQALSHEQRYHLTTKHHPDVDETKTSDFKTVWKKIKLPATALFSIFVITFLIFPGLITGIDSQYEVINNNSWMPVILIAEFNICDYIGRQFLASWTSYGFDHSNLWIPCVSRIILYPLFIILYKGIIVNEIVAHATMIVFSMTNGHFCCLAFIYTPSLVKSHEQETCAAIMSSALVSGIFVGAACALIVSYLFL